MSFIATPEQQRVVDHKFGPAAVEAVAGAGKTRVVEKRIMELLALPNPKIAVFSYTKTACLEVASRLRESFFDLKLDDEQFPAVSTIHSYATGLVMSHSLKKPEIIDEDASFPIIRWCLEQHQISTDEKSLKSWAGYIGLYKSGGSFKNQRVNLQAVKEVVATYNNVLRKQNKVDFNDIIDLALDILEQQPAVLEGEHNRWKHIFIDEFQDVNGKQYALIRTIAEGAIVRYSATKSQRSLQWWVDHQRSLMVVGDTDQAIMKFQGGSPELLLNFTKQYPYGLYLLIEDNWRCSQVIGKTANVVININDQRVEKALKPRRAEIGHLEYVICEDEEDEAQVVAQKIQGLHVANPNWRIAILVRRNYQGTNLAKLLRAEGMHVQFGATNAIDLPEYRQILGLIQLAVDPDNYEALAASISSKDVLNQAFQAGQTYGLTAVEALASLDDEKAQTAYITVETIAELIQQDQWQEAVAYAVSRTRWIQRLLAKKDPKSEDRANSLWDWIQRSHQAKRLVDLEDLALHKEPHTIEISTMHSSKGRQWDAVFIFGMYANIFPAPREEEEDERNLFYVAITRAISFLCGSTARLKPSLFFGELMAASEVANGRSVDLEMFV